MGRALLNLSAWLRAQDGLRAIYQHFPQGVRFRMSQLLASRVRRGVKFKRTPAWQRVVAADVAVCAPACDVEGVNIFAYARGQFGLAESARLYARALLSVGCPVAVHDISLDLAHSMGDDSLDLHIGSDTPHAINLIFVNPDYLLEAVANIGRERLAGRYTIACWFWELEKFPDEWLPALSDVDEFLASSRFIADIIRGVTDKPILQVPLPVLAQPDSGLQRSDFGLAEGVFVLLCSFDFNSFLSRKNPLAVVEAFRRAFADDNRDVCLVLKSSNGHRHPEKLRILLNAVAMDSRILIRDEVLDRSHVQALQRCADVYISLHRSEGFGLGLAECMRLGKPVIATAWSGNMEFMTAENSCLVDYKLVPVGEGEYLHYVGQRWADPDIDQAAGYLRRLQEDREFAARIGACAARDIGEHLSAGTVAAQLTKRLRELTPVPRHHLSSGSGGLTMDVSEVT